MNQVVHRNLYQEVGDLVEHDDSIPGPSVLQWLPFQLMYHAGHASRIPRVEITGSESGCLALYILQLLDLLLLVRVPYCGGVFKDRPDESSIGLCLDVTWATP